MSRTARYIGQAAVYGVLAVIIGVFADTPSFENFPADKAEIKVSFAHGGERKVACRRRGADELAKLPPNMRKPMDCPRERVSLLLRLTLDGRPLFQASLPPTGLSGDGASRLYEKFRVPPGRHVLVAELRDSPRDDGFDYTRRLVLDLRPRQIVAVDFRAEAGGFVVRK